MNLLLLALNIDVAKASASIGYTGLGVGVYLAEISGTNSAINSLGKTVEFTWGINSGIGANFNIGPKTSFGLSFGVGITFSFEVKQYRVLNVMSMNLVFYGGN